ncbi:PfaD family polyunsaturated fatty acid/polyketide biosynthesis protein [Kitasatospora phosalacinea]|uniref:PfaD family polyunsaturated fatty acid/polyketide biosynthesis protein n=1 Tax=Kitasatospora phosalacinea TaxID=2065 RepID=UPI0005266779|nr:PfaD family polyunsaturated fatty acid/polyketide biosynthesis protein [Kitasatospora phosalacinea]
MSTPTHPPRSGAPAHWTGGTASFDSAGLAAATRRTREHLHVVGADGGPLGVATGGLVRHDGGTDGLHWHGTLPPLYPEWLGDRGFGETHGTRYPYIAGEMARGISSVELVTAMAEAGLLSLYGAGGLAPATVEQAVDRLSGTLRQRPNWGVNLLHSPLEPAAEERTAALLVARRVPCVSLSAYLRLTPAAVRVAAAGLRRDGSGRVVRARRVIAKLSRPEVAREFLSPAPPALLRALLERGELTAEEAELASLVPIAEDLTVESDSGGHTDNRPLGAILPVVRALRDRLVAEHGYDRPVRVGAAGGLGSPEAVAAAFAAGADYVVTGTVNQLAAEAGTSDRARRLLAGAGVADVAMAPAADMFEMGVRVQVLSRGTLFAARADLLYRLWREHDGLERLPAAARRQLETEVFGEPLETVWERTRTFWADRDPAELDRAEADPKHRMALVFRSYLGQSSGWATGGVPGRDADYQIWCGPAVGAFNDWRAGSVLDGERPPAVQIALNLLEGATVVTRAQQLRSFGVPVPPAAFRYVPRQLG